ncbi:MAG: sigma-54 dependent transcriptional regulator [Patescibacteria group bacterium]
MEGAVVTRFPTCKRCNRERRVCRTTLLCDPCGTTRYSLNARRRSHSLAALTVDEFILERPFQGARGGQIAVVQRPLRIRPRTFPSYEAIPGFLIASEAMHGVVQTVQKLAAHDTSVLIHGETGVGKDLIARLIHRSSRRFDKLMVVIDCAALTETLAESELFGHARGSFTGAGGGRTGLFESTNGGTIFLDEIGELSLGIQARLLRVLESRVVRPVGSNQVISIDVRIVAATNKNLFTLVDEGRFRLDLLHRLYVADVVIPPLRVRREEIPAIALHLASMLRASAEDVLSELDQAEEHSWPGNVRELRNAVERAMLGLPMLSCVIPNSSRSGSENPLITSGRILTDADVRAMYAEYTNYVVRLCGGNKRLAATRLGLNRTTLHQRIKNATSPV